MSLRQAERARIDILKRKAQVQHPFHVLSPLCECGLGERQETPLRLQGVNRDTVPFERRPHLVLSNSSAFSLNRKPMPDAENRLRRNDLIVLRRVQIGAIRPLTLISPRRLIERRLNRKRNGSDCAYRRHGDNEPLCFIHFTASDIGRTSV